MDVSLSESLCLISLAGGKVKAKAGDWWGN